MTKVRVCQYGDKIKLEDGDMVINTTSRSNDMGRAFSPFLLGSVRVDLGSFGEHISRTVENAWQYSKVYKEHLDLFGDPSAEWHVWAQKGFEDLRAVRYPMGKNRKPEYSWHKGAKLSYVEAREKIYVPLYTAAVQDTEAFLALRSAVESHMFNTLWLRDFDGYDHIAMEKSWYGVVNDPMRKMGHAFVLWALLTGEIDYV